MVALHADGVAGKVGEDEAVAVEVSASPASPSASCSRGIVRRRRARGSFESASAW